MTRYVAPFRCPYCDLLTSSHYCSEAPDVHKTGRGEWVPVTVGAAGNMSVIPRRRVFEGKGIGGIPSAGGAYTRKYETTYGRLVVFRCKCGDAPAFPSCTLCGTTPNYIDNGERWTIDTRKRIHPADRRLAGSVAAAAEEETASSKVPESTEPESLGQRLSRQALDGASAFKEFMRRAKSHRQVHEQEVQRAASKAHWDRNTRPIPGFRPGLAGEVFRILAYRFKFNRVYRAPGPSASRPVSRRIRKRSWAQRKKDPKGIPSWRLDVSGLRDAIQLASRVKSGEFPTPTVRFTKTTEGWQHSQHLQA